MNTELLKQLISLLPRNREGAAPEVLVEGSPGYQRESQVFNTRFQFRPAAIVLVETQEQVSEIVKFANRFPTEITLRVRSGGHDHEGECSGTGTVVIDFSKMNSVTVAWQGSGAERQPLVSIGPGARFQHIKPILDKHHLGIPHGTCKTVGIAGFTLGGGWGPWTRLHGMACERLIGATLVLGNGEIVTLGPDAPADSPEARLLWALRGGGGFSYGIVTELRFRAFELPEPLCSFILDCGEAWPERKALEILKCWEDAIAGAENPRLIGTNLKMVATHLPAGQEPDPEAFLSCTFNGYFAGTEQEALDMIERYFKERPTKGWQVRVQRSSALDGNAAVPSQEWLFESWDRTVPAHVPRLKQQAKGDTSIVLDGDGRAPHKITSRLAEASGWNDESRKALICALQSPLVPALSEMGGEANHFPIVQYITLGAITGPFYSQYGEAPQPPSAFPYKDRLFTLQFQAWWNQYLDSAGERYPCVTETEIEYGDLSNRPWVNRAEDWIAACRDVHIPGTSGAFISFKDSSVLTQTYFAQSYAPLRDVKREYSMDKNLLFRTRKTII